MRFSSESVSGIRLSSTTRACNAPDNRRAAIAMRSNAAQPLAVRGTSSKNVTPVVEIDLVCSDIPNRGYDRNRVFMGVTASY